MPGRRRVVFDMSRTLTPTPLGALMHKPRHMINGKTQTLRLRRHIRIEMVAVRLIVRPINDGNTATPVGDDLRMEDRFLLMGLVNSPLSPLLNNA